ALRDGAGVAEGANILDAGARGVAEAARVGDPELGDAVVVGVAHRRAREDAAADRVRVLVGRVGPAPRGQAGEDVRAGEGPPEAGHRVEDAVLVGVEELGLAAEGAAADRVHLLRAPGRVAGDRTA